MNKKNKILVGCLALLLALSVGYALFGETITINGTATAKGNFDMTATCESGISSELGTVESLGLELEGGYDSDSCTVSDNIVSANVNFNTIGLAKYFTIKVTNSGSIDAVLDMSKVTKEITACSSDDLNATTFDNCSTSSGGRDLVTTKYVGDFALTAANTFYAISDENDNILSSSEIGTYYDSQNGIITLPPKYSGYLILKFSVDHRVDGSYSNIMNVKITTSIDLPFTQAQ